MEKYRETRTGQVSKCVACNNQNVCFLAYLGFSYCPKEVRVPEDKLMIIDEVLDRMFTLNHN